jgi:hypothetical protein
MSGWDEDVGWGPPFLSTVNLQRLRRKAPSLKTVESHLSDGPEKTPLQKLCYRRLAGSGTGNQC